MSLDIFKIFVLFFLLLKTIFSAIPDIPQGMIHGIIQRNLIFGYFSHHIVHMNT